MLAVSRFIMMNFKNDTPIKFEFKIKTSVYTVFIFVAAYRETK